jgi:hypothetical protein
MKLSEIGFSIRTFREARQAFATAISSEAQHFSFPSMCQGLESQFPTFPLESDLEPGFETRMKNPDFGIRQSE